MIQWAFDTESGLHNGHLANRVITYAPVGIRNLSDVRLVYAEPAENVYEKFWQKLLNAETDKVFVFHVFNLDWEIKPIQLWFYDHYVKFGYPLSELADHYSAVLTDFGYYEHIFELDGLKVKFVDDNNHLHCPLKDAIDSIQHIPKYRAIFENNGLYGKESDKVENLHEIWYRSPNEPIYLHYAKVDAFGTALVTESLFDAGRFSNYRCFGPDKMDSFNPSLSASGAGFKDARCRILYGCGFEEYAEKIYPDIVERVTRMVSKRSYKSDDARDNAIESAAQFLCLEKLEREPMNEWNTKFGLLTMNQQLLVEQNLRGGFVWGLEGHFKGRFWHYDYKSSYPYEYVYGKLPVATDSMTYTVKTKDGKFIEKKRALAMKECSYETFLAKINQPSFIAYLQVEFSFALKPDALPLYTLKECPSDSIGTVRSKKPRTGHTKPLLMTYDEWMLTNRLYDLSDITYRGFYYSRAKTGLYTPAISEYFNGKEHSDGVVKALHKLDLNGATHGRPLLRRLTSHDLIVELGEEIHTERKSCELSYDELDTCPLQGFVAMSNARVRLITQCMDLIDAGYKIYMCDTDSMITDCPPNVANDIWVNNNRANVLIVGESKKMSDILGKLEIEPFSKHNPKLVFDELIVWGLKRYLEKDNGEYRKSAFAGMKKELQRGLLMKYDVGDTIEWDQLAKKWVDDCYALRPVHKIVEPEEVWA